MKRMVSLRTVARKSSNGGFAFVRGGGALRLRRGGLTFIVDKSGIDLHCFIFQFRAAWSVIWGDKPTKFPVATGLVSLQNYRLKACLRFCAGSFRKHGTLIV